MIQVIKFFLLMGLAVPVVAINRVAVYTAIFTTKIINKIDEFMEVK